MKTELKQENLSIRQKLGMVMVGHIYECHNKIENLEYALKLIRNHSLGAIWVEPTLPDLARIMKDIREKSKKKALKPNGFKANLWWGRMGSNH